MNIPNLILRNRVKSEDIDQIREIVVSTGFFYDFEMPVAVELAETALEEGDASGYHFILAEVDGRVVSYACYGHIAGTDAGYDLYWIVTHNDFRGTGIGKKVLESTEEVVKKLGGRYIVAETSSLEKYTPTRGFYLKNDYTEEGRIQDYYKVGDAKVIYVKRV
ncbi:MAG: GNAT family N-acetyltransferase [Bacteroidota bacterium]